MQSSAILAFAGVLVVAGVIILIITARMSSGGKQHQEVPIYEGRGKKRKVVAYQRMNK